MKTGFKRQGEDPSDKYYLIETKSLTPIRPDSGISHLYHDPGDPDAIAQPNRSLARHRARSRDPRSKIFRAPDPSKCKKPESRAPNDEPG
jgi:hypothetical protein